MFSIKYESEQGSQSCFPSTFVLMGINNQIEATYYKDRMLHDSALKLPHFFLHRQNLVLYHYILFQLNHSATTKKI